MMHKNFEFQKELEDRTKKFALSLIKTLSGLSKTPASTILIKQVIRSGTSIGANYREACEAESAKDFVHKIKIAKKEAKETEYWLDLILSLNKVPVKELSLLLKETNEFVKIFSSISSKFKY